MNIVIRTYYLITIFVGSLVLGPSENYFELNITSLDPSTNAVLSYS